MDRQHEQQLHAAAVGTDLTSNTTGSEHTESAWVKPPAIDQYVGNAS